MKNILLWLFTVLSIQLVFAQEQGEALMNAGSAKSINAEYRTSVIVGQGVIGPMYGFDNSAALGFYSKYLLPPFPPVVTASEGDFVDRIQIDWLFDALSPNVTDGYALYKNGAYLANVVSGVTSYVDYNVVAGTFYNYEVAGINDYGEGNKGSAVGFVNPNGMIAGQVTTMNNNPVKDVTVFLEPTIGNSLQFDGVDDYAYVDDTSLYDSNEWSISLWVKQDAGNVWEGIIDHGRSELKNWWILTTDQPNEGYGVLIGMGDGTSINEIFVPYTSGNNDWHHVAATFNGSELIAYLDGNLVSSQFHLFTGVTAPVVLGAQYNTSQPNNIYGGFKGNIDDVRIFDRQLSQTEIQKFMYRTVPSSYDGLLSYWKFDEGIGSKAFDLTDNNMDAKISGALFDNDKANVLNSGITDVSGYYLIEGINYGSGQAFTVTPEKQFAFNTALEFSMVDSNTVQLTDFSLADTAVVEMQVSFSITGQKQVFLSKNNQFELLVDGGNIKLSSNGNELDFGSITTGYHHIAIKVVNDGVGNLLCTLYIDGSQSGSVQSVPTISWGNEPWYLGSENGSQWFFTGLIDEVAFYNDTLSIAELQLNASQGINESDVRLAHYFNLNESIDTIVNDIGYESVGTGVIDGALWTDVVALPNVVDHEFNPDSRVVTMNPSNSTINNIDFTDVSTIPVSGVVRFENTLCFAEGVEILVNGNSHSPPIYTNADGRFQADFEPGSSFLLQPKLEDHTFMPASYAISNISVPKAGILFLDEKKKVVTGQIAGGLCRYGIMPSSGVGSVHLTSNSGCIDKKILLTDLPANGKFSFTDLPPVHYTIAVENHPNPAIDNYFQLLGGESIDHTIVDDSISQDFIYRAGMNIETSALDTNSCGTAMLTQFQSYNMDIRVFEEYNGQKCYLDSVHIEVDNLVSNNISDVDTIVVGGTYKYEFGAASPNLTAPYLKSINIVADDFDRAPIANSVDAVIVGKKDRNNTFATTSPEIPFMILRDPPGDGSYSYLNQGTTVCNTMSTFMATDQSNSSYLAISEGVDFEVSAFGFAQTSWDFTYDVTSEWGVETNVTSETERSMCITANEMLQTPELDEYVGSAMGADLYVGGALNLIFGIVDELKFDTSSCIYYLDTTIYVRPEGFATQYMYTEDHIKNTLIPNLSLINDSSSIKQWNKIIDLNIQQKTAAVFESNLSFNGGVVYEYSQVTEVEKSSTLDWTTTISNSFALDAGLQVNGIGVVGGVEIGMQTSVGGSTSSSSVQSNEVGYHLEDDESIDYFTVDVLKEKTYGTPVFNVRSGASSCPYEPGTQPHDEVDFVIDHTSELNVPSNGQAVFNLTLGNLSQSGQTRTYSLAVVTSSNPDGAIIRANGTDITSTPMNFDIPAFESQEVTLTVEKGPVEFTYNNLQLKFYAACEADRADDLGIATDSLFNKEVSFNVDFVEPCSEVDISFPLQNFVVTPIDNDSVYITLSDYSVSDVDLQLVRVQYRPVGGSGAWINIVDVPKDSLDNIFEVVVWEVSNLADGDYEIRAITQCSGSLPAGISTVITGTLERKPPAVLGTPEPADGILGAADQIYIDFTENINCSALIVADQFYLNNVGLYDLTTGQLVDINISCLDNRIYIVPNVAGHFLENHTLEARVQGISDLAGNSDTTVTSWEFYYNESPLSWVGTAVDELKEVGVPHGFDRTIENSGGNNVSYTIATPEFIEASIISGTIPAGGQQVITFTIDNLLYSGEYTGELVLSSSYGDEVLPLNLRVMCESPEWYVNQSEFDFNMNYTIAIDLEGVMSDDPFDMIGGFIDGQCRGVANIQYEQSLDKNLAFLSIYGNTEDGDKEVTFKLWDASACKLYDQAQETFNFAPDGQIGTPLNETIIHSYDLLAKTMHFNEGWNWVSFNLEIENDTVSNVMAPLMNSTNGLIKSQTAYSQYSTTSNSWVGQLDTISEVEMYRVQLLADDSISFYGRPINTDSTKIPLSIGWNWIGYIPQGGMTPDHAFQTVQPLNGDILKNQYFFAQYVAGEGWIGNLTYMNPLSGYLYKSSVEAELTYPLDAVTMVGKMEDPMLTQQQITKEKLFTTFNDARISPNQFSGNMNIIGVAIENNKTIVQEGDELYAYINGEVRGVAEALYIESSGKYVFFLTAFANSEETNSSISFKYFNNAESKLYTINETVNYIENNIVGLINNEHRLTVGSVEATGLNDIHVKTSNVVAVYPNPFKGNTKISYFASEEESIIVSIYDNLGKEIAKKMYNVQKGDNTFDFESLVSLSGQSNGIYTISIVAVHQSYNVKLIKQ